MHYELYIDLLFLENFMMDSLLLLVLNRVLKCKSNWQMCGFYGRHDDSIPAVFKVYQPFLWDGSGNGISLCEMLETVKKNKRKRTGAV